VRFEDNARPGKELWSIGWLNETRSENGDLLKMFIEAYQGGLENLVGDNLLYFRKFGEF
jgi:hypothetical protein